MRIVFISHMFPNSLNTLTAPFMAERAKALSLNVKLQIIAPVSYFPFLKTNIPPHLEIFNGLKVHHPRYLAIPSHLWSWRWFSYLIMLKIMSKSIVSGCDILHVEWIYPDAYAAVRFAKKRGIKTIGVVHGNEAIEYYGPHAFREKYCEVLSALDHVIVVSKDLKTKLVHEYGVSSNKISIILNGVDVEKFTLINKNEARTRLGMQEGTPIGVCVARLSEEKNLDILIQAVAKLADKSPFIYIVGDGPLRDELQKLIECSGVDEKVKLIGSVPHEQVSWWLNASDFFCLPSQREGCPVVIHEALACGRPVVSTKVGAIPDLICRDDYGLLCPPDDVDALVHVLGQAVSRVWDTQKISAYGRQFTWEKMAEQTVKVFHEVLS